jgi:uncharacterized YccA/Bax inhibitor family protein
MAAQNPALNPQAFQRGIAEAPAAERRGMTVAGAYVKSGLLLVIVILAAVFGWSQVEIVQVRGVDVALQPTWTWLAFLLTFIFGIAGAFAVRAAAIIGPLYALSMGALLGIASRYFNLETEGIVGQAVLATICVFAATLLLYSTGAIKVTSGFAMGVMVAMGGLALLYATAWLLSLFGVSMTFLYRPTPLGILFSLGVVVLGALNLPLDFAFIERAAKAGAPKFMEWYAAYGLMLSIIWLYVSILRLLALTRRSN